jgi:chemotaxis response regulator CheB
MPRRDVIVLGGSAGGLHPVRELLSLLPAGLRATVFIGLHRSGVAEQYPDALQEILARKAPFRVVLPKDGQAIEPGCAYLTPRGCGLIIETERLRIERCVANTGCPTSIDVLFNSAALAFKQRVAAVMLSGMMRDGVAGLSQHGGVVLLQDPVETQFDSMVRSALQDIPAHYCLSLTEIARKLVELVEDPQATLPGAASSCIRVLIVEDERIVALNLAARLEDMGYKVAASVASAEEALQSVLTAMPDVVLMDIHLAGKMRGTEAGKFLSERYRVPVIYLTAYSDAETLEQTKPSMPYGYIIKPYSPAEVHAAIELALDRRARETQAG